MTMDEFNAQYVAGSKGSATQSTGEGGFSMDKFNAMFAEQQGGNTEPENQNEYGILDRQRDTVIAQTGNDETTAGALWSNVGPGILNEEKKRRDIQRRSLESFRNGSVMDEINALRERGEKVENKTEDQEPKFGLTGIKNALTKTLTVAAGYGAVAAEEKQEQKEEAARKEKIAASTPEETYFDRLEEMAIKQAGMSKEAVKELRGKSASVDEFAKGLSGLAESTLLATVKRQKEAQERLQKNKPSVIEEIANGLITNTGYQIPYLAAGLVGKIPYVGKGLEAAAYGMLVADVAEQRANELMTKRYDVDTNGNLIVRHTDDDEAVAWKKGTAGAAAEVSAEIATSKVLGWAFKGMKVPVFKDGKFASKSLIPSAADGLGKVGDKVSNLLKGSRAGTLLLNQAKKFHKIGKITGVNEAPIEILEEHVQSFVDDVIALGEQDRAMDPEFSARAKDWWNNSFWNLESNKEIFLNLLGTQIVQGGYALQSVLREEAKIRKDPAGFLKTMIDEKVVDKMSTEDVIMFNNLVIDIAKMEQNKPGSGIKRIEQFLEEVNNDADKVLAATQIKNAAEPWAQLSDEEMQKVKSKYQVPMRDSQIAGGKEIDFRQFELKNGEKVMRATDSNTHIAIDRIDPTHFVVTSRNGVRVLVTGKDAAEAGQRALAQADKFSIQEQIDDASRQKKIDYINERIAKFGGRDKIIVVPDIAKLLEISPETAQDTEFKPYNPAVRLGDGRIAIVADNVTSGYEANRLILHESGIHAGLRQHFKTEDMANFLAKINSPELEAWKKTLDEQRKAKGLKAIDWTDPKNIEEAFAHFWDRRRVNPSVWTKAVSQLREWGRKAGLPLSYNEADLETLVGALQEEMRQGTNKKGEVVNKTGEEAGLGELEGMFTNEGYFPPASDMLDVTKPGAYTPEEIEVRKMERAERIKKKYPNAYKWAMKLKDNDEDAAIDWIAQNLRREKENGYVGELEHGTHALLAAEKLEQGRDLSKSDLEILDEHGFTGQRLYSDFGYRKQANGSWRQMVKPTNKATAPKTRENAPASASTKTPTTTTPKAKEAPTGGKSGTLPKESAKTPAPKPKENYFKAQAEAKKKEIKASHAKFINGYQQNPMSLFAFRDENGRLLKMPPRVRSFNPDTKQFEYKFTGKDPSVEALNHFFEGLTGEEYQTWMERIFGKEADRVSKGGNDTALEGIMSFIEGGRQLSHDEITNHKYSQDFGKLLSDFADEWADYEKFLKGGSLSREEQEAAYLEQQAAAEKADEEAYYLEQMAAQSEADEEYNNALGEVMQYGVNGKTIKAFTPENLKKLNRGDMVRFDHSDTAFDFVSYNEKTGELVLAPEGAVGNPLLTEDEQLIGNVRYVVTAEGISEYKEENNGQENENRADQDRAGDEGRKEKVKKPAKVEKPKPTSKYAIFTAKDGKKEAIEGYYPASDYDLELTDQVVIQHDTKGVMKARQKIFGEIVDIKDGRVMVAHKDGWGNAQTDWFDLSEVIGVQDASISNEEKPAEKEESKKPEPAKKEPAAKVDYDAMINSYFGKMAEKFDDNVRKLLREGIDAEISKHPKTMLTDDRKLRIMNAAAEYVESKIKGFKFADVLKAGAANNAKMELAKRESEKHIVTYGNGMKDTLANMIKQGVASIYVGKDLYTVDINELEKGNVAPVKGANVVTIGFESFKAWPKEVPYLLQVQAERDAKEREEEAKPKPKPLADTMTRDEAVKILRNNPVQFYSPLADLKREYNATPKENERKRVALAKAILEAQDRAEYNKETTTKKNLEVAPKSEAKKPAAKKAKPKLEKVDLGEQNDAFDAELDAMFFNPDFDLEGGQGGNEYAIMFRHKDETPKQHYERLVKYYGRGIERAGKTFERALQSLFASERSFSEGKRRLQSVLKTSRIAAITPRGNETINDWVVARGYTKSTIYIPLGNEATEVQLKVGKILLHNEAFGDKLPLKIVGFGENNGILYAIGETRNIYKSNTSPYTWFRNNGWTIGRIADGFDGQGAEYFENTNYEVLASSAHIVTVDDGREIPFGVMIFDKRNNEYAKNRKPGKYQGDAVQQTLFFNPDMDVKSEEEIEANNLIHGVKAIRAYAKAGRRDFATFAKAVATRKPEVYARIKTSLRGMWNTAIDKGVDLDEVSRDEVKKILADLDAAIGNENGESGNKKPEVGNKEPKTETAPKKTETRTAEEIDRTKRVSKAADEVLALINKGVKFDRQTLTKAVEDAMGAKVAEGKLDMKDVYDIMELAINRKLMSMPSVNPASAADVKSAVKAIEDIRKILAIIPTQTTRTAEQDKMQQFSTPPHEAFMAAWVANVGKGDVSLEPSAGIGGIALYSKMAGADVIVNELSPRRASILAALGLSPKVYDFNAEDLYAYFYPLIKSGEVQRPTVVVMNPPFSNSQRTSIKDTFGIGGKHIEEALEMLAPGGRLVAIVGHGMAHDSESSKAAGWWKKIGSKYQVRADIRVNGKEYQKYGTTYDNNMIVIDKVAPNNTIKPIYGIIESLNDLPALLEGVRNERPIVQTARNVQEGERSSSEQTRTGNPRENGQTGNGGTSERAGSIPRGNRNGSSAVSGDLFANGSGETIRSAAERGGRDRSSVGGPRRDERVSTTQEGAGVLGGLPQGANGSRSGTSARTRPEAGLSRTGNGNRRSDIGDDLPLRAERQLDNLVIDAQNGSGEKSNDIRIIGNGTFAEYRPSKVNFSGAKKHPTPLQETTAMASVLPPDPTYKPILPKEGVAKGRPSDAQIEQILYAGQAHEQILPDGKRRGYFIGDGTGVGKGTEIAGIIADNFNHGRKKAIWITEKRDLIKDTMRDLNPYGLGQEVFDADPDKAKTIVAKSHGVAFSTYSSLIQNIVFNDKGLVVGTKKDKASRFQMLVDWFGKDYDGVIVFDESHNAANAVATTGKRGAKEASQAGQAVVALQEALPNARILYVSATGATEVSNLAYATRLGLWGQGSAFRDRESFVNQVSAGGLSVMEIVARDMKSMGVYMARSLSWEGVENRKLEHKLSNDQKRKYNEFADAWQMVSENIRDALIQTKAAGNSQASSQLMSRFYSASQNFFNQILTAMQMPSVIADAKAQLEAGNSIVFQLVDTNEAAQNRSAKKMQAEQGEINAEELDLSPRDVLIQFVERSFPTAKYVLQEDEKGNPKYVRMDDSSGNPIEDPIALEAKQELLDNLRMMKVDENPLELIINEFGAENVAEITGRSKRREWVENEDGIREMRLVPRKKALRTVETDEFNEGKRRVLVFSKAGGTGRSFHADRTFKNHQKRIHYLIQAGWKADAALQGFGRTHRSNEAQPPEYVLVSTDIKGHQRFISTIARRLAQLGSLTAGDRSSAGSGIFTEADNLENSYAKDSVYQIFYDAFHNDMNRFNTICKQLGFMYPKMNTRTGEAEEFNSLVDPETKELKEDRIPDVSQFLNRILMSRVDIQNELFDEFVGNMTRKIENAKASGKYDPGLQLLKGDSIEEKNRVQIWDNGAGTGKAEMVEVSVGKKAPRVDFEEVSGIMRAYQTNGQKTMFAENLKSGQIVALAETNNTKTLQDGTIVGQYRAFRPNGKKDLVTADGFNFSGEKQNFRLLNDAEAEVKWNDEYAKVPEMNYTPRFFIQGTLLPIWDKLNAKEPHIYRIAPSNGSQSFLGLEVKADNVNNILKRFGMATQQVKLSPEVIRDRILKEGKPVELQFDDGRLSLKRAKVNGDYRIEVEGFANVREMSDFAQTGLGFTERIGFKPRFFIPVTVEGLEKFLEQYPAKTEDGGIGGAQSAAGSQYAKMSPVQLNAALTDGINRIFGRVSFNQESWDSFVRESQEIMSVMQTGELRSIVKDFTQYDRNNEYDPVRKVRKLAAGELIRRGESVESLTRGETMFFNPDFDVESPLSAVSIYEMNMWREARGMPIYSRKPTTTVKSIVKEAKYRSSNAEEMERLVDVVNRTPMNLTATEITATHQHLINLEKDWEAKDALFNEALLNGNAAQAEEIKKARDLVLEQIDKTQDAIRSSARQWGLAGLARRFMLNRDGNFVKFLGSLKADAGRKLTGEEEALARQLWKAYEDAQGKLDFATVKKTAEVLKDIVRKHNNAEIERHIKEAGKNMAEIERDYLFALDHIAVHAGRAGGLLTGLPNGRKWIDAIRRFHMAASIQAGHKMTVDEMLAAIHGDIDGLIKADDHDILQMITNYGNTYKPDDSAVEKALRDQREMMRELQKQADMLEGKLPKKTGRLADTPSDELRKVKRDTAEIMRNLLEEHPELMAVDNDKKLRTIQQAWMRRVQNEINDLQKAIETGSPINRKKSSITYNEEMKAKRAELEAKRAEYADVFPPAELSHTEKVNRILKVLNKRKAELEAKLEALQNAKTPEERAKIIDGEKKGKVKDAAIDTLREEIEEIKSDIADLETTYFPAGTPEQIVAAIRNRISALEKNIEKNENKLLLSDLGLTKKEPSALKKLVESDREVIELTKKRNAVTKRLAEERKRYQRSLTPFSMGGKVLDWWEALTSAPRVFRTMLDLSATFTQAAALTASHPVLGARALVNSIKAFQSEMNTDEMQVALNNDPDWQEFQEMGGHAYVVSDIDERDIPEEFRGMDRKLLTVNGKEYGLTDIPYVGAAAKASERSFGMFLNTINLSLYKALKNASGWGPTGPSEWQKRDLAASINVASGYGYESKGGQGLGDKIFSFAIWAPRFAVSGLKMATAYNVWSPLLRGKTNERSYADRLTSSKMMAKEYVRNLVGMAAWTLLATLLFGRKDPEYLEEVLDPRSSEFLNVLIGNTRINFFGPIKQWWQFMARILTQKTRKDGKISHISPGNTLIRFGRSKASPIVGTIWNVLDGKDFQNEEYTAGKFIRDLTVPLSAADLLEAFKENDVANALFLTPFIIAGAAKSTYQLNDYDMQVNPYRYLVRQMNDLRKQKDFEGIKTLKKENPILMYTAGVDAKINRAHALDKQIKALEKDEKPVPDALQERFKVAQQEVIDFIKKHK